jgi:hypothetical protein
MAKILAGDIVDLLTFSKAEAKVGQIVESLLDFATFSNEHLGIWYPLDGRSCSGTAYHALSGKTTIPDAMTDGMFLRQAKSGRVVGSAEADEFKSHTHIQDAHSHGITLGGDGAANGTSAQRTVNSFTPGNTFNATATNQNTGGAETRPKNIAVNYYIKVNY